MQKFIDPVCSECRAPVAGNHGDGKWRHLSSWTTMCNGREIVPQEGRDDNEEAGER